MVSSRPRMPREGSARPPPPPPPARRPDRFPDRIRPRTSPPPNPRNELDNEGHCAGEYASAGGHAELTNALIDHAVSAEMVLGAVSRARPREPDLTYLSRPVRYDGDDKLLDTENDAVMMDWEAPLMRIHAAVMCAGGGDTLNVGFGMGIIDGYVVGENETRSHTIVEAHPDVHAHMLRQGWGRKRGVVVEFGRWQEVLDRIIRENESLPDGEKRLFDGVNFDTYGEDYDDLREFHALLPKIMRPGGVYTYFNGLAPDNIFFHTVYCRLAQAELASLGFETKFDVVDIDTRDPEIWRGVKRRYWWGDKYFLPTCTLTGAAGSE